jgi:hypothetical protein
MEMSHDQAKNFDAANQLSRILRRAERRMGEMLADMERAKGAAKPGTNRGTTPSPEVRAITPTISGLGMTYNQSANYQKLAKVPKKEFERQISADEMPTNAIITVEKATLKYSAVHSGMIPLTVGSRAL